MTSRFVILLWLALSLPALAQRNMLDEPRFASVGDAASISDGVVTALAQDETGFLWVGTPVGVVRYDGYQLRPFVLGAPNAAPRAATQFVRALLAAPGGILWVGLEGEGLAQLDTARQRWTLYKPDLAQPDERPHGTVRALARDRAGVLWVGTTGSGLYSLAPQAERFERHTQAQGQLPDDRVHVMRVDSRGTLWVGTWRGLVRKAPGQARFEPVFSSPEGHTLAGRQVTMLGEGPDGRIWVGTRGGGLAVITPDNGRGHWIETGDEHASPQAVIAGPGAALSFVVAPNGELWIGRDRGLDLRDSRSGALVMRLRRALHQPWGLAGHNVLALVRDRSDQLWIGSYGGGLQRHSPSPGIWVRRGEGAEGSPFADGDVRSLHQMRNGEVWAGTPSGAVVVFDRALKQLAQILPSSNAAGPGGRTAPQYAGGLVGALTQAADDQVWVGTDSGVYAFSPQRQLQRHLPIPAGRTRRLLAATDGSLWAATQDGVYRLAPGANQFQRLQRADGGNLAGNLNALVQGADGTVWVGGNAGLWRVAPGELLLHAVPAAPGASFASSVVLGLLIDRRGQLWVDTNAGLHRWSRPGPGPAAFEHIDDGMGDGGTSFGANLLEDEQGRIWTHRRVYDPRDGRVVTLGVADGADIGTGWFRAYTRLDDGRLLFGGSTGTLVVAPAQTRRWQFQPPVVATDLRIQGERQPVGLLQPVLELQPQQRRFSIEFAALDLTQPDHNRYRFRLEGFDTHWNEAEADFRVASYGNLAPGDYRLQVQGSNRLGDWSPQPLTVALRVLPAWWQTWWAQGGGVLLVGGAVWALVQLRTGLLRRRQAELEAKVSERTHALEALSRELQLKSAALEASSLTDPLTGLHNRRFLAQHMASDAAWLARRHGEARPADDPVAPASVAAAEQAPAPPPALATAGSPAIPAPEGPDLVFFMIDVDHFKQVNDRHGHAAGDAVLLQLCQRLKAAFREADYVVRWGGEEFLVAARGTTRERAAELAERARHAVADQPFTLEGGQTLRLSCSVGFAAHPLAPAWPGALDWSSTVDLADAALYRVKRGGRDGWFGLLQAEAADADALRRAARLPLAQWLQQGGLQSIGSRDFAQDLDLDPRAHAHTDPAPGPA